MTEHSTLPLTEVVVFDGFDDLDAIAPLEVLTAAGFPTRVVRPSGHAPTVHSAHGLVMRVDAELGAAPQVLIVPGVGWLDAAPGVRDQCEGALPAAILLARAGLVTGRPAVTNHNALDDLAAAGADVQRDARVVDDGSVVTAGGPAAGLDLAVRLVARFGGQKAGREAAARLEHTPVGPVLVGVGAGAGAA
jgi:transcriptional regulator GlxA family with amidase domain